jgi:hypothetical protein
LLPKSLLCDLAAYNLKGSVDNFAKKTKRVFGCTASDTSSPAEQVKTDYSWTIKTSLIWLGWR